MRLALRLSCVIVLAGAGWAVYAAERSASSGVSPKVEKSTLKLPAKPQASPSRKPVEVAVAVADEDTRPSEPATPLRGAPVAPRGVVVPPTTSRPEIETDSQVHLSLGTLSPTPDMWYYEQARADYNNPAVQVRRKAEADAAQRRERLAYQEWYGYSSSRPDANCTPFTSTWSARRTRLSYSSAFFDNLGVSGIGWW